MKMILIISNVWSLLKTMSNNVFVKYPKMNKQAGFTVVEVFVVIAIMGVLSVMGTMVYSNMKPTLKVNGAARMIMGDFMWAKMKAVTENNDYIITFGSTKNDFSNNMYLIYDDNDNDGAEDDELVNTVIISDKYPGIGYGGLIKVEGTTLGDGKYARFGSTGSPSSPVYVTFQPSGRPTVAGTVYIMPEEDLVTSSENRMRAITVSTIGRTRIRKYNTESSGWE